MNLRDHQICELLEDGADISKRLFAAQKTVERMTNTNANIIRELVAELRRLRISQLRRMAHVAMYGECGSIRDLDRWRRFADACLAEIERLRGEG